LHDSNRPCQIKREGTDVTVIAWSKMLLLALRCADRLSAEGIHVEVIDLRTLKPLDLPTLIASVRKTGRAVVIEEGWEFCGVGAQIATELYHDAFDAFDAPIERVTGFEVPTPYAKHLEQLALPTETRVIEAVKKTLYR
ncbi:MAG TPA: transketolase C-terminal domain-containing protein, partial [Nitrospiria bacterium]|nr:transketolase C-terminal domain-containing protein [Nitrospiria bacterium]